MPLCEYDRMTNEKARSANFWPNFWSNARAIALISGILIVVALILSSCIQQMGSSRDTEPGTAPAMSATDRFLSAARSTAPDLESVPDSTLLDAGRTVCAELDAGTSMSDLQTVALIGMGGSGAAEQQMAGAVIGAATGALCPEHK